jgi:hypothetical protein
MRAGAALVLGLHESLPAGVADLAAWPGARCAFRKSPERALPAND